MRDSPPIAHSLMEVADQMQPMIEVAEGQRKAMEERGWSPAAAEAFALELLLGMTRLTFTPQTETR